MEDQRKSPGIKLEKERKSVKTEKEVALKESEVEEKCQEREGGPGGPKVKGGWGLKKWKQKGAENGKGKSIPERETPYTQEKEGLGEKLKRNQGNKKEHAERKKEKEI